MKSAAILSSIVTMLFASSGLAQQISSPLTLDRVIESYIAKNPQLLATRYRIERTQAEQIAARLRPNPGVLITAENLPVSGPSPFGRLYEVGISYTETVELGGKRELRMKVAEASVSVAEAQFADTLRRGIAEVKRLYMDALLARYNVSVATENQQTFQQLLQINLARFQEGRIPEADLIKVRLERIKFESAVKQAELGLRQATIRLLDRLGESTFSVQEIAGDLETTLMGSDVQTLRQVALANRADILAAEREVEAAAQRLAFEQTRGKPDLLPFVGYKRVARDNTIMAGLSIPLKTRDHNQAGIARAAADEKIAQAQLQSVRNHALAEVESAYAAFQTTREQVQTFRNELLNQAEESRSIALAAYQEGATALLPVLEAQRTRAEVRRQYFQTLFDYQVSLTDLELAIGKDLQP
jgi:cobalt-zinc-cadmium efflux system outer membrane protein